MNELDHPSPSTGLIGVGLLGLALAERLIASEMAVRGFDINAERLRALTDKGGVAVSEAAAAVEGCGTVFLSLPSSEIVWALFKQLRREFRPGQIIVDSTTGDPSEMVIIGQSFAELGVHYVEALVAGSSAQVRAGQVALFVGGDVDVVRRVEPLLAAITAQHFHLGPVGSASRFKLVHNLLLGLHRAVLAEGLTFAQSLGFDPADTLRILQQTPAASAVMETKGQRMVSGDYTPQARLSQHLKDVRLILAEAERAGLTTPLSEIHRSLLEEAEQLGFGDSDNSAVMEVFRHRARETR